MLVTSREGKGAFHTQLSQLLSCLFHSMIEQGSRNPYPIISRSFTAPSSPPGSGNADQEKAKTFKRKSRKQLSGGNSDMLDVGSGGVGVNQTTLQRGLKAPSSATLDSRAGDGGGGGGAGSGVNASVLGAAGFRLPAQVLVFPVVERGAEMGGAGGSLQQWDFYLLTEEEVSADLLLFVVCCDSSLLARLSNVHSLIRWPNLRGRLD